MSKVFYHNSNRMIGGVKPHKENVHDFCIGDDMIHPSEINLLFVAKTDWT